MIEVEKIDLFLFQIVNGLSDQKVVSYGAFFLQGTNLGILLIMASFWWFWFRSDIKRQRLIIAIFIGVVGSLIVARLLASLTPFRVRPMYALSGIEYQVPNLPAQSQTMRLEDWSSFPSDHAALYFAFSYGLWLLSRMAGVAAFSFAVIAGGVARIVLGIHYPSDIIVGAPIGVGTVAASCWLTKAARFDSIFAIKDKYPHVFYSAMFIITMEIAVLFEDVRFFVRGIRLTLHDFGYSSLGLLEVLIIVLAVILALAAAAFCVTRLRAHLPPYFKRPTKVR
jgi:membrane-associated phospholipid phosphatase